MSEFGQFKAYGSVARQMQSLTGRLALQEIVDNPHNRTVPLLDEAARGMAHGAYDTIQGMTLIALNDNLTHVASEIVPPADMSQTSFLELCRDLNFPLQREMQIDISRVFKAIVTNSEHTVTAVSYLSNSETARGFALLHVPEAYVGGEVAESVRQMNQDDGLLTAMDDMALSTTIAATLFDYFSGALISPGI